MAKRAAKKKAARRKATPVKTGRAAKRRPKKPDVAPETVAARPETDLVPEELDPLQFIKEFDTQLDVLLDIKQSLETDLADTRSGIAQQRRTNEEMMQQLQQLEAEVQRRAGVRNEVEFLHAEIAKASAELKELRELLEEKKTTTARKDERVEKLQAEEKEMRAELAALKEQHSHIRNERTEADSHLQVAKLERSEMMLEIRKLREILAKDEERAQAAEAELEQARMALSKLHGSFEVSKRKAERILKK